MELTEQVRTHNVTDYVFNWPGGAKLNVTVDHDAGDSAEEFSDRYLIRIAAKQNLSDPDNSVNAEQLDILKSFLGFVSITHRKQRMPTEEELFDMRKLVHSLAKNVQ